MISRTRFKQQIVTEFIPPKNTRSRKVIILCNGLPSIPKKNTVMKFLSELGYWVFFPRYRGSWESGGKFLQKSPHQDILDILDELPKGFTDLWTGKRVKLRPSKIVLLGSSFGGAAVLLAAQDKRVDQVIALAPVCDWRVESKAEPLDWFGTFIQEAFGNAYRFSKQDWNKLKQGNFFNPIKQAKKINGKKILILHGKNDAIVDASTSKTFADQTGAKLVLLNTSDHFSTSRILEKSFFNKIKKHL